MELRKKPIPAPMARAKAVRALVAASSSRALPTVAALLAATSLFACTSESTDIAADQQVMQASVHAQSSATTLDPLPGMGALEIEAEPPKTEPVITPTPKTVIKPPIPSIPRHAGVKPPVVPKRI